jgi:hypothetical protein
MSISGGYDDRCLDLVWDALHEWQLVALNRLSQEKHDEKWDDICLAMAWIEEELPDVNYVGTYNKKG